MKKSDAMFLSEKNHLIFPIKLREFHYEFLGLRPLRNIATKNAIKRI